ncbi:DUF5694 domain-containing protein [Sporosarcina thermotolerans]|nr:DUF5694 domain-containing protein [Sporosarcina thermotolerans]WHT47927.1 DUF5694 domain-containing protein [Sporosarcina thermotolerans]
MTEMHKKPTILMLGTFHMGETADVYVTETDDLFSETRQKEIKEVVERLSAFKPTKVAVEVEKKWDAALNEKYDAYINGEYELEMNEVFQLGFRVAKDAGLPKVDAIDWMEKGWGEGVQGRSTNGRRRISRSYSKKLLDGWRTAMIYLQLGTVL